MAEIPVINFSVYSLEKGRESVTKDDLQNVKQEVYNALSTVGFCYLKDHGFPDEKVEKMMSTSKQFFELPNEVKEKYAMQEDYEHGWVASGKEHLSDNYSDGDCKESMNYVPLVDSRWSDERLSHMRNVFREFYKDAAELTLRILDVISLAFLPDHRNFFRECHSKLLKSESEQTLRSLYYPPVIKGVNDNQPRCGEHSDYGTVTVLWQDDCGGLEIRTRNGEYIKAVPIPGTVLINIGDLMQRWTADQLVATRHVVVQPAEHKRTQKPRQSIAFFAGPNNETLVQCLDGSEKYKPVLSKDYYGRMYSDTYTS